MTELPQSYNGQRWITQRKQLVAAAVIEGRLPIEVAKQRYRMLDSELELWCRSVQEANPGLLHTSQAYNETNGTGWVFPEIETFLSEDVIFGEFHFKKLSVRQNRDGFLLQHAIRNVVLTTFEADILKLLARFKGSVVLPEMIMCYRYRHRGIYKIPDRKVVDVVVCNIRSKTQHTTFAQYFETVWGRGYLLRDN